MLVLSRKVSGKIMIGDAICVTVLKVAKGRVKLGFTAPRDVAIHREEICREEPQIASPSFRRGPR